MKISKLLKLAFIVFLAAGVSLQAQAQEEKSKKKKKNKKKAKTEISNVVETDENTAANLTLADLLRRKPGVRVQGQGSGTTVAIRGGQSSASGTNPLFVVDRVPVGTSYTQVEGMVNVQDIKYITILKGADASKYGTRGNNGVVEIVTKKK